MIKEDKIRNYLKENEGRIEEFTSQIHTIGNPIKFKILWVLDKNERCHVKNLSNILEMTHSACSQHISKLKDQGLIAGTKDGKNVFYSISPESAKLVRKLIVQFSKNLDS